jgi:hypothetical protein
VGLFAKKLLSSESLVSHFSSSSSRSRDGNGDPIPDSPRGIHLLGDGDGKKLIPTGI